MARNRRERRRSSGQSGIVTEHTLTKLLGHQRVVFGTSPILDHTHKIDALVHEIKPLSGFYEPIALQITQKRDELEKIRTFYEAAGKATKGPLLYAEIDGRVTPSTAAGVRNALAALWLEIPRNATREHRIVVRSNGQYEWLSPLPKEKPKGKASKSPKT